ncbi:MAG: diaminohydroxyphosphoribosylaminopyrimidine deaminase [Actinomycetota bacterium]|nr:diaminohydroxyphosphoribosylaminopyrimidine deaminase [Actinomycetota bacterium]
MTDDERYMALAIDLARRPPFTSPNPRVGAVVVRFGDILSEGAHEGAGTPHAEAVALAGIDASGSTLYVNLEPCAFHGRTPPCADAVVSAGVERVVVAIQDPDPRVDGRGLTVLRDAGIDVEVGILAREAETLNAPFLHHRRTGRPYVTLKLALSMDGKMGASDGTSRWITGPEARRRVHARRLEADAVLIGTGTAIVDDPTLLVTNVPAARQPRRIVVDSRGTLVAGGKLFDGSAPLTIATTPAASHDVQTAWKEAGAEVSVLSGTSDGVDLPELLDALGKQEVMELYCEGGAALATSLLRDDVVDRLEIYHAPLLLGGGGPQLGSLGVHSMSEAERWEVTSVERVGEDLLTTLVRGRAA